MKSPAAFIAVFAVTLLAACASSGSGVPGEGANRMGDPDFLLREEILESNQGVAYDVIRNRRPQWLQTRGISTVRQAAGEQGIVVYLDNARMGFVDSLRRIGLASVQYMQFFTASEATQRWGANHLNGAILVSTEPR